MKSSIIIGFLLIVGLWLLGSCVNLPTDCGADSSKYESRIYSISTDGSSLKAITPAWSSFDSEYFQWYGIDPTNKLFYYTEDIIGSPQKIIRFNLVSKISDQINVDNGGINFTLSPDGKSFLYERGRDIGISLVNGSNQHLIPRDTSYSMVSDAGWLSNDQIIYDAYGEGKGIGMFEMNLSDSSITKISSDVGEWGWDFSSDRKAVVLSTPDPAGAAIVYKDISLSKKTIIDEGSYPNFVDGDTKILYETKAALWISDLKGNKHEVLPESGFGINNNIAVINGGKEVLLVNSKGLWILNIGDETIKEIVSPDSFLPPKSDGSVTVSLRNPIISRDGSTIYFIVGRSYYYSGC